MCVSYLYAQWLRDKYSWEAKEIFLCKRLQSFMSICALGKVLPVVNTLFVRIEPPSTSVGLAQSVVFHCVPSAAARRVATRLQFLSDLGHDSNSHSKLKSTNQLTTRGIEHDRLHKDYTEALQLSYCESGKEGNEANNPAPML